jgi:hypothetical protein
MALLRHDAMGARGPLSIREPDIHAQVPHWTALRAKLVKEADQVRE